MKIEFSNINDTYIVPGKIFYLYGNYKKTFDVFCDFLVETFRNKFDLQAEDIKVCFCTVRECVSIVNSSCDLFGTMNNFLCIRNIEDTHLENLNKLFMNSNDIFILESGDYAKSKRVTDFFVKSSNVCAIASFKNDTTLMSLCKLILPMISQSICREIVGIINDTDEDLLSLFKKISLLIDNEDLLKEYTIYKRSFLDDMDFIPLLRYFMKLTVKEKLGGKKLGNLQIDFSQKNLMQELLKAEMKQKSSYNFPKSYIYHLCKKYE